MLTDQSMIGIATLECGGHRRTYDRMIGTTGRDPDGVYPVDLGRPQPSSCNSEQRGRAEWRPCNQATTLGGGKTSTGQSHGDTQPSESASAVTAPNDAFQ